MPDPAQNIDRLLAPRSIAIIGASEKPSIGRTLIDSLSACGYSGAIYPVNPKYESIRGHPCYSRLDDIDARIDVLALAVRRDRVLEQLEMAAATGVGAAVIYGGGFAEIGAAGGELQAQIIGLCNDAGIALCGPNCMGAINTHQPSQTYMMPIRDLNELAGNVALISQSGSVTFGMLADVRRYGFSYVVSTGNEAVINSADYIEYFVRDNHTEIIALFSESILQPERFIAALDYAADAGKPVVVLKVGKSQRSAAAVQTHTGGLAGDTRVFSSVLRAHRAIEVDDLEEMAEVLAAWQGVGRPKGRRFGVITSSGGHAEFILDVAARRKLNMPPLPPLARHQIEQVTGPLTGDGNPVDAWGQGTYITNFTEALRALDNCDVYDNIVLVTDGMDGQPIDEDQYQRDCADLLLAAAARSHKAYYVLTTRHGVFRRDQTEWLKPGGIPILSGVAQGLGAVARLSEYLTPAGPIRQARGRNDGIESVLLGAHHRPTIHEYDSKRELSAYGVPVTRELFASSLDGAVLAAKEIGFPIVLKVVADDVPHRTDAGLVAVGIRDPGELAERWSVLQERWSQRIQSGPPDGFLIQEFIEPGVEIIIGVKRDPAFGLFIAVGSGGILTEILDDVAMRPLPLRDGDAEVMLDETRVAAQLCGVRGGGAADRDALVAAIYAVADFAIANGPYIAGIDVNPMVVHEVGKGCVAVDALIIPQRAGYTN